MKEDIQKFYDNDYKERGMQKWAGFMSSEKIMQVNDKSAKELNEQPKALEEMCPFKVARIIEEAIIKNRIVSIQLMKLDINGDYSKNITGRILGYEHEGMYVSDQFIGYNDIRHIEIIDDKKWSDTDELL